jgi:aminoglycoside phosphotransferase (APT) family kinase protein
LHRQWLPAAMNGDVEDRFAQWCAVQLGNRSAVTVEDFDRVAIGHSAETLLVTLRQGADRRELVVRMRPEPPGLLEPYDLGRQFTILKALERTAVLAPAALWYEPTGQVLGREFYVMERLPGQVYERGVPAEVAADPEGVRRMCEGIVAQLAEIHRVDLTTTGLASLGDGRCYLEDELDHWSREIERVKRGALPALESLVANLRASKPEQSQAITLVHGDPKPGNFAFVGDDVTAVFDWEMATVGDPLADIGWVETLWDMPGSVTACAGALSVDELVTRWESLTGLTAEHRSWYRAFQAMKMAVILLLGSYLVDSGHSTDLRRMEMAYGIRSTTQGALRELGMDRALDDGPVLPRKERRDEVRRNNEVAS